MSVGRTYKNQVHQLASAGHRGKKYELTRPSVKHLFNKQATSIAGANKMSNK